MGNPASVKRKLTEKRRKRHEDRLGPGAYLPKADREQLQAELKKLAEQEAAAKAAHVAAKAQKAAAKQAEAKK